VRVYSETSIHDLRNIGPIITVALSSIDNYRLILATGPITSDYRGSWSVSISRKPLLVSTRHLKQHQRNAPVKRCLPYQQLRQAHHRHQTRVRSQTTTSNPRPTSLPRQTFPILQQVHQSTHLPHRQDSRPPHLCLEALTIIPRYHIHKGDMARYGVAH
jgi:hypothetical protein